MSVLTRTELEKLSVMYEGDKNRDATSKIRGFLFQDYVAIMSLLKNQVKYICLEYLEDDTFEIIQVKYYPKTSPKMKEISTDLYYQYLRLQMLQSTLNDFSIEMTKTLEREVSIMCNLSKGVEEKGIEKGILLSIRNLMETMGWSVEQAMEGLKIPEEEKTKYLDELHNKYYGVVTMNNNRPTFNEIKSYDEFVKYYWYRDELSKICKQLGIDNTGTKQELNQNIKEYFK